MKKILFGILLLSLCVSAGITIDASQDNNMLSYIITNNADNGTAPTSGKLLVKENDAVLITQRIYAINGVYQNRINVTGNAVYKIIYTEDDTNKVTMFQITAEQPVLVETEENTTQTEGVSKPEEKKDDLKIFSLQSPLCYLAALIIAVIGLYYLYQGFTKKKKEEGPVYKK